MELLPILLLEKETIVLLPPLKEANKAVILQVVLVMLLYVNLIQWSLVCALSPVLSATYLSATVACFLVILLHALSTLLSCPS